MNLIKTEDGRHSNYHVIRLNCQVLDDLRCNDTFLFSNKIENLKSNYLIKIEYVVEKAY